MRLVSRSLLPGKPGGRRGNYGTKRSLPQAAFGHLSGMATTRSGGGLKASTLRKAGSKERNTFFGHNAAPTVYSRAGREPGARLLAPQNRHGVCANRSPRRHLNG